MGPGGEAAAGAAGAVRPGAAAAEAGGGEGELDGGKAARKAAKKAQKALRRAKREGRAAEGTGSKDCELCRAPQDLLIRCTTDETGVWRLVCGKCWKEASGGVTDGDADHPHYRYGGLWKNRNAKAAS